MRLYLIRHGVAADSTGEPDEDRALTDEGRDAVVTLFGRLRKRLDPPRALWTSPLVRAVQTAELSTVIWGEQEPIHVSRALLPGADPKTVLDELQAADLKGPVALVGHEPHLGRLLALITGTKRTFTLPKGSVCRLRYRPKAPGESSVPVAPEEAPGQFVGLYIPGVDHAIKELSELKP